MARVVHFEIPVNDPQRCEKFYRGVFGWNFQNGLLQPDCAAK